MEDLQNQQKTFVYKSTKKRGNKEEVRGFIRGPLGDQGLKVKQVERDFYAGAI